MSCDREAWWCKHFVLVWMAGLSLYFAQHGACVAGKHPDGLFHAATALQIPTRIVLPIWFRVECRTKRLFLWYVSCMQRRVELSN